MAPPPREAFHGQGGAAAHKIKKAVHIIFEPLCPLKGRQPFWQRGWNQMKRSTGLWTAGALIFAIVIGVFSVYSLSLIHISAAPDFPAALALARAGLRGGEAILVCGSLYLCGEAESYFRANPPIKEKNGTDS